MKPHAAGRRTAAAFIASLALLFVSGCGVTSEPDLPPVGQTAVAQVPVDSDPMGATIYVNGRPAGMAPVTITVEVNEFGDMVDDLRLEADFSSSLSSTTSGARVEREFTRGDKPPSMVRFRTDSVDSRIR